MRKLLDCTLRDGGYINDWRFGKERIFDIAEGLATAGLDYVELGFLEESAKTSAERSKYSSTADIDKRFVDLSKQGCQFLAMVDYGACSLEKIVPCEESILDCIRVMFKKESYAEALEFCGELKAKGYKVFVQPVSVTRYADEDMSKLISIANMVKPFAVSVVDTYGLLHQSDLLEYVDKLDRELSEDICIGYHGHNNFQMGYANCISIMERESARDIIVDVSLYGMGKSAGNAPTELVAMYMNHRYKKGYKIDDILNNIEKNILPLCSETAWGYSLPYFLAAYNECHPKYVQYYREKKELSIESTNAILSSLDREKSLVFDEDYAETIFKNQVWSNS